MIPVILAALAGAGAAAVVVIGIGLLEAWWHPEHRATARLFEAAGYRPRDAAWLAVLFLPHSPSVAAVGATATLSYVFAASWLTISRLLRNLPD